MWHFEGHHFWGMHWLWWILWVILIFWVFATPYDVPGQKKKKDSPLDILKRKYASGEISSQEFEERKKVLEIEN